MQWVRRRSRNTRRTVTPVCQDLGRTAAVSVAASAAATEVACGAGCGAATVADTEAAVNSATVFTRLTPAPIRQAVL